MDVHFALSFASIIDVPIILENARSRVTASAFEVFGLSGRVLSSGRFIRLSWMESLRDAAFPMKSPRPRQNGAVGDGCAIIIVAALRPNILPFKDYDTFRC